MFVMKVCRKCKKHVTNKSKICKYCGADVSKSKIIRNNKNNINKKVNNIPKKKDDQLKDENKKVNIPVKDVTIKKDVAKTKVAQPKKKLENKDLKNDKKNVSKKIVKNDIDKSKKEDTKQKTKHNKISKQEIKIVKENKFLIFSKFKSGIITIVKRIKAKSISLWKKIVSLKSFKNLKFKKAFIVVIILLVVGVLGYSGLKVYRHFTNYENTVVVSEKATNKKVFAMGDVITCKNVNYEVINVKTSMGNSYKSPKEGNIFLIITVSIENEDNNRIQYSYENWTMSNSKGSESKRIFSSINVDTALYSGDLVIGGIKRGSMVFEQPKNDKDLRLNFYELKTDKDGEHFIDSNKKMFSVSIKIPEKKKKLKSSAGTIKTSNKEEE